MSNRPLLSALAPKLTIKQLRSEHPDWEWSIDSRQFGGCTYRGYKGDRWVRVYATAQIVDAELEIFQTVWRAEEGGQNETYGRWSNHEQQTNPQPTAAP